MGSYSALNTGMDACIGRVLAHLDKLGLTGDTLVVFTADQGHMNGHHGVWGKGNATVPFNMYEESIRVPMIWRHPGRIPGGRVIDAMVSSYDFFPTMLDYLGVSCPPARERVGRSYTGFLRGPGLQQRDELFFEYCYVRAVRTATLKYVERTSEWPSELFDLEKDPGESRNLIVDPAYAERLSGLKARLQRFFEAAGAPPLADWTSTTRQALATYGRY
jgi:arylsulfatase A-like enzyme